MPRISSITTRMSRVYLFCYIKGVLIPPPRFIAAQPVNSFRVIITEKGCFEGLSLGTAIINVEGGKTDVRRDRLGGFVIVAVGMHVI